MPSDIIQFTIILTKPVLYEKILTLAFAATALLTVNAADVMVYNNGALAPGLNVHGWYQAAMDFNAVNPTDANTKEWNSIVVNIKGVDRLNNMSIRFNEDNASDILLSNIYFSNTQIPSGVEATEASEDSYDVFNLQGVRVRSNADNKVINELPTGIYFINGKKVLVK